MAFRYDELARAALAEITPAANVGEVVAELPRADAEHVTDVVFASAQAGYRGWSWVVSVADLEGSDPTVLELGLIPGEDALLAPEWIPWSVRLAEWQAQQAAAAAEAAAAGEGLEAGAAEGDDDDEDSEGVEDDDLEDEDEDEDDDDDDEDEDEDDEDEDEDDDDDDDDDEDEDEDDDELTPVTHGGDIDGVDIDDLDDVVDELGGATSD